MWLFNFYVARSSVVKVNKVCKDLARSSVVKVNKVCKDLTRSSVVKVNKVCSRGLQVIGPICCGNLIGSKGINIRY